MRDSSGCGSDASQQLSKTSDEKEKHSCAIISPRELIYFTTCALCRASDARAAVPASAVVMDERALTTVCEQQGWENVKFGCEIAKVPPFRHHPFARIAVAIVVKSIIAAPTSHLFFHHCITLTLTSTTAAHVCAVTSPRCHLVHMFQFTNIARTTPYIHLTRCHSFLHNHAKVLPPHPCIYAHIAVFTQRH